MKLMPLRKIVVLDFGPEEKILPFLHMCRNGYLWASSQNSDSNIRFSDPDFLKTEILYWPRHIFLCFWPLFLCTCTEMEVILLPVRNLILLSFSVPSVALISCKRIEIFAIRHHFEWILAIFSLCMHRTAFCETSSQNSDTAIWFWELGFPIGVILKQF